MFTAPRKRSGESAPLATVLDSIWGTRVGFTESRLDRLSKSVTPELLEKWRNVVASLPTDDGAVELRIQQMWQEAALLGMVPTVAALDRRLDKKALSQFYREKKALWMCQSQQQSHPVSPRLRARSATFGWDKGAWRESQPLAGPLFEFVWDALYQRNVDELDPGAPELRWWDAAAGSLDVQSSAMFPWPLVDFSMFSEYDHLATQWNDSACLEAIKLAVRAPYQDGNADALAYWYADYVHSVWHRRERRAPWRSTVSARDWRSGLACTLKTTDTQGSDRPLAEWARVLPLLAAPESGLSADAASAILEAAKLVDGKRDDLRAFRRRRAVVCVPGMDPEETIASIDAQCPDHPWLQLVERDPLAT